MRGLRLWFPKWFVLLDRLVVEREKAGIWELHRSASTYYAGKSWLRHAGYPEARRASAGFCVQLARG